MSKKRLSSLVALAIAIAATAGCGIGSRGSSSWSYVIANESQDAVLVRIHFPEGWWPVIEIPAGMTTRGDSPRSADHVDLLANDCAVVEAVDWHLECEDSKITIDAETIEIRRAEEADWTKVDDPNPPRPWIDRCP